MMSHIVESCPLTRLHGGLSKLHLADDDAIAWLASYGSYMHMQQQHHCSQTVGGIKMPLGTEVGLSPGHIVLDGDPAPSPLKELQTLTTLLPMPIVAKLSPVSHSIITSFLT